MGSIGPIFAFFPLPFPLPHEYSTGNEHLISEIDPELKAAVKFIGGSGRVESEMARAPARPRDISLTVIR